MAAGRSFWVVLACVSLATALSACGVRAHEESHVLRLGDDVFATGSGPRVANAVSGDLLIAGGEVYVDATVGGDVAAAGGRVDVRGSVSQDLYAAGGNVRIEADVAGSARVSGGDVEISDASRVSGGVTLAGGNVRFAGQANDYLQISGGRVRIDGRVAGDVHVTGRRLDVGPQAVIEGTLTYQGPQDARVAPGAEVRGGVRNVREGPRDHRGRIARAFLGTVSVLWALGWLIVGVLLLALLPGASQAATAATRTTPWFALLVGFVLLVAVPAAIVLFMVTLIGIPLGLLLLFAYLVLLPLGYLTGVASVSDGLLARFRAGPASTAQRIGAFVAAVIVIYLLMRIPVLGALLGLLLLLFGMGGLGLAVAAWRSGATAAAA